MTIYIHYQMDLDYVNEYNYANIYMGREILLQIKRHLVKQQITIF